MVVFLLMLHKMVIFIQQMTTDCKAESETLRHPGPALWISDLCHCSGSHTWFNAWGKCSAATDLKFLMTF